MAKGFQEVAYLNEIDQLGVDGTKGTTAGALNEDKHLAKGESVGRPGDYRGGAAIFAGTTACK